MVDGKAHGREQLTWARTFSKITNIIESEGSQQWGCSLKQLRKYIMLSVHPGGQLCLSGPPDCGWVIKVPCSWVFMVIFVTDTKLMLGALTWEGLA